jgi:pyruvate dehydrogenase (quinone)
VLLIASQVVRRELGSEFIQEVDFKAVYKGCSVFCEMIITPESALRLTVAACQAALTRRGVAVLIVPADIADADAADELPFSLHCQASRDPSERCRSGRSREPARCGNQHHHLCGSGCQGAHDEVVQLAGRLQAPMAHTTRGKDALEYDNPHNVGMTGVVGMEAGYHAILNCDTLLLLGTDFAWAQFYPKHATIIQVDIDPTHIGRRHPVTFGVVGNIKDTLQALLPRIQQREASAFREATYPAA